MALRVVSDEEKPALKPSKSVAQAAKGGDQRELLVAMRDRIAESISGSNCMPRDLASLTKRLQDIVRDIAVLDAVELELSSKPKFEGGGDSYDASVI